MTTAGNWLRSRRMLCGLGLREFAEKIGDSPSNVCNIERGKRLPWKNAARLKRVAGALSITEGGPEWSELFSITGACEKLPPESAETAKRPIVQALLKEIASRSLSQADVMIVVRYVRRKFIKRVQS